MEASGNRSLHRFDLSPIGLQSMNNITRKSRPVPRGDLFGYEPMGLICIALFISWLALMCRIISIW